MASLSLFNPTTNGCSWEVSGLSKDWNTLNYYKIVISKGTTTSGTSNAPSGVVDEVFAPSTGNNRSVSDVFSSGLNSSTTYTLYAYACTGVNYWDAGSSNITTTTPTLSTPSFDTSATVSNYTSIELEINPVSNADTYHVENVTTGGSLSHDGLKYEFAGLELNTSYGFRVKASGSGYNDSAWSSIYTVTTKDLPTLDTPSFITNLTEITSTTITVAVGNVSGAETYYAKNVNTGEVQSSSTKITFDFTNLTPNTSYQFCAKVSGSGYNDSNWSGTYTCTTLEPNTTAPWSWYSTIASGVTFNISAQEWLDFCSKINEVRVHNGLSNYSFTTSSTYIASGKPFSDWIANQAINAINDLGFSMLTVQQGDNVPASLFINMKNNLNSKI